MDDVCYQTQDPDDGPMTPVKSTKYQIIGPYQFQIVQEEIKDVPGGHLLLKIMQTGICPADLRYISCSRPPEILKERLPMAPFHEAVATVAGIGEGAEGWRLGERVIPVPNIPCYVHNPQKYSKERCAACRPGGKGENFCTDVKFCGSNKDGFSAGYIIHPQECIVRVPDEVEDDAAVLTEPISVLYAAMVEADISHGCNKAAVLGSGSIGYLATVLLSHVGKVSRRNLLVTDIFDSKLELSKDIATILNTKDAPLPQDFKGQADRVFECVGGKSAKESIDQAITLMRPGGVCVLLGVSEEPVPVRTRVILDKGLTFKGTTRSSKSHFLKTLEILKENKGLQEAVKKIIYKNIYKGDSVEELISASRTAGDVNVHGKVIIKW
ncbi:MAG: alcohol dehydrogenase catalytic domain-containing protein [Candidatus Omnitrophica bacterium]|nr:alcohol dehydrogenase catalytic domain-containing protein [Candidatus Omnitrophota bacterium]